MELAYAFFAEAAQITADGKVNVLGADARGFQGRFPLLLPSIALVAKVELDNTEREGVHHVIAQMLGPDGADMEPRIEGNYEAPPPVNPELKASFTILFQIFGMTFPTQGVYTFRISVDGRELKRLRLRLTEAQEQPSQARALQEATVT